MAGGTALEHEINAIEFVPVRSHETETPVHRRCLPPPTESPAVSS
jgi:hypothetical protein